MYLVYKTDAHHSYASRDLLGVCTNIKTVFRVIRQQVEKEDGRLTNDEVYNLQQLKQTYNYHGPGEFQYEEISANTLL